jgi:MoxR-like ATPase
LSELFKNTDLQRPRIKFKEVQASTFYKNLLKMEESHQINKISPAEVKALTIIFVSGLPGIGKSTLFKNTIEHWTKTGFSVVKVESDVVRQQAIKLEKLKPENAHLTPLELEIKSKPVYTEMLH